MDAVNLSNTTSPTNPFAAKRIHFIGIGGSGMSGLARILLDCGAMVSGSDPSPTSTTLELAARGAQIVARQDGALLHAGIDLVVRTAAVADDNPEVAEAHRLGIRVVKYAAMLGLVMKHRHGVAVAGTHGKSTTTAMLSYTLLECGQDISFVVGGTSPQLGGGSRSGADPRFIVEACEFDRSFHNLYPTTALITNIEEDHLDCYGNIDQIVDSFAVFLRRVPTDGLIIANGEDRRVVQALAGIGRPVELLGMRRGFTWSCDEINQTDGCYGCVVCKNDQPIAHLQMQVAGKHNLFNAALALAAAVHAGVDPQAAADALGRFTGVDRRMTELGRYHDALVVDDYAHHPTEIRTTLKALRERYRPNRLFCIFQPHQHSRTRLLLEDFACSFAEADQTVIPDIFFARDSDEEAASIGSTDLVERAKLHGHRVEHIPDLDNVVGYLREQLEEGDLVVTMGAGNVWQVGKALIADTDQRMRKKAG